MKDSRSELDVIISLWQKWAEDAILQIDNCSLDFEPHPPPSMSSFFQIFICEMDDHDMLSMFDIMARFIIYLHENGIEYNKLIKCDCYRVTEEDVKSLTNHGEVI